MFVIMRYMGQRSCTNRAFSKESHLFFKKTTLFQLKNYRFVSVLPTVSKIFERIMQKQIIIYINHYHLPCYLGTEKASLHKQLCFISLKNGTLF